MILTATEKTGTGMDLGVGEILEATGGTLVQGSEDCSASGVSTDSREGLRGTVFFALRGPNFDAHAFVEDALENGASGAVVESGRLSSPVAGAGFVVEVADTLRALGDLARYVRKAHGAKVVAVGGSAGKTTTKEMTAAVLKGARRVLKTEGNRNNLIGLPLTLLSLDPGHDTAVVELGISEDHEMPRLVEICSPDVAVLTNIGRGHLASLGSVEGVARAKEALFKALGPDGVRVVNLDDPWVVRIAGTPSELANSVTYSATKDADVRALGYKIDDHLGGLIAEYDLRGVRVKVRFASPGVANVMNGAAAMAAVLALGVHVLGPEEMARLLSGYTPVGGRMDVLKLGGLTVLDDTYNANPESMRAALMTLAGADTRKVAVLGDMLELGTVSEEAHREAGAFAALAGVDVLVAIGRWAEETAGGALGAGLKASGVHCFKDRTEAARALGGILRDGDSVLVKGSRSTGLDEVVEELKRRPPELKACL